jgi:hypothetical protein
MTTVNVKDIATIVGLVVACVSLVFTAVNTRLGSRTNRARFWLDLRDRFTRHDSVHRRLRPGGSWADGAGPTTPEEWADVEAYMGLFEHCEVMLHQHLLDEETFNEIYGYRVENILANDVIRCAKLVPPLAAGWKHFLALVKRMDYKIEPCQKDAQA